MRRLLRDLLHNEQRYVNYFFENLDIDSVEKLLQRVLECPGVLLFSGIGKSGLVAKKIAVTMVSTGTKAFYLSPMSAVHGDLGIVSQDDLFFVFSKSGQTEELLQLIPYVRNKGAHIVAIVCEQGSRLEKASDETIYLPFVKELCPFDMAPTISAAIQMLFGDLLAVALMRQKKFSLDEYALNHPAGRIGRRLTLRVEDLMIGPPKLPQCHPEDRLVDVIVELSNKQCGCLVIVDREGILQGIFTDGDLRRALQEHGPEVLQIPMKDLMNRQPKATKPGELATQALHLMEENQSRPITVLPVLGEKNRVIGLLKMHDIVQTGL